MKGDQQTADRKYRHHGENVGKQEQIIAQKERRTENGAGKPAKNVPFMGVVMW